MANPLNATFFAFRKREKSGVLTGASIAFFVLMLILFAAFAAAVFFLLGGPEFLAWYSQVMESAANGQTNTTLPPGGLNSVLLIVPLEFLFLFALCMLFAAYEAAAVRWMVQGETSKPFNLHFGADMWRAYGTYWAWFIYTILGWVGLFVLLFVVGLASGAAGDMGGLITFVACVGYILAWFYVTVRLSPATATSIGIGRFAPLKAWSVTRGRFWSLFGAYLLLTIVYVIAAIVLGSIFFGAFYAQIFSGLDWTAAQTDPEGFARSYEQASLAATQSLFSNPAAIALYVGGQVVMYAVALIFYLLWFGVESRAVIAAAEDGKIEGVSAASLAKTFQ
jgi:hypothetical protein